jgi:hypothetical protein
MSPIALAMNLVLALLLVSALGLGMRLERKLKALREGQDRFAGAVAELDRAAQRAETGLAELRMATEEAVDLLAGRIEKARELATRLERFTAEAARPVAPASRAPTPQARPAPARPGLDRAAARPSAPRVQDLPPDDAEAAAEDLVLRLTESQMLAKAAPPARQEPRPTARSRASVDDDLFEAAPRALAGGRR